MSVEFEPTPEVASLIFGDRLALAESYHDSLATTATERGFIGPKEVGRLWSRHIMNCAIISEAFDEGLRVADIGSGAGLPGIPVAIARPDLSITLIEPLLKRSTYLSEVKNQLELDNVTVIRGRAEDQKLEPFDVVTSRAVAPLGKLAGWSLPLVKKGGAMVAMKGASVSDELERDAGVIKKAGGGQATIFTVGDDVLAEPTTLIRIERAR
ncbi:16S rRNA (guanine(527)-N(7))-methyltransferase RsmG [Corynebacterium cystitidis]|uniref:Ribosomal RNA small subunit methyltransferase G n=1 Tax=Corynebacterium cystitidis DSM 20524 TaxID=1121357 RepID=A0A1H9UJV7_9CORY|nr:16S rRNA (guanine(527)-N(7))-methyltransferase RsmG [Corynebacterium cystitidis]WJY83768.1 Ribosomal RNA small subunit methyltransferase G [Corynebacterium cystitidis DSM 20524]SES09474.1 16S rRNA m(7)G-527 methyltransferase [Corynebacterium cystitidis DSM 20524]SNV90890.1 16S rRNA methyltransferase GidB [Corynebacterium cystitidis]